MAKEIRWAPEAIQRFDKVIEYLNQEWSSKEVVAFVNAADKIVRFISENPKMFRKTSKRNVHEALVTSHNLLIYKVYQSHSTIITFWDTRQHPNRKKLSRK
jgi:plasmid stabilization system protein ParE